MKIIVGLGNPGIQYENTRHSLGFELADILANKLDIGFNENKSLKSMIAKTKIANEDIILVKPQTFMNSSGEALRKIADYYKVPAGDIIVACDDTYLETGVVRIRFGGQAGGHNGLKSIISNLGSEFWRMRLGIGDNGVVPLENYVLSKIPQRDGEIIRTMIDKAAEEMIRFISEKKFENKTIK